MVFTFRGAKYYACNAGCRDSYKVDMKHGLIYGPYKIWDSEGRKGRFVSGAEFSMAEPRCCIYCGKPKGQEH